jgi:hypothetical protein
MYVRSEESGRGSDTVFGSTVLKSVATIDFNVNPCLGILAACKIWKNFLIIVQSALQCVDFMC